MELDPPFFPEFTTERLRLEPFNRGHSQAVFALWLSLDVCLHSGQAADWDGNPVQLPARTADDSQG